MIGEACNVKIPGVFVEFMIFGIASDPRDWAKSFHFSTLSGFQENGTKTA